MRYTTKVFGLGRALVLAAAVVLVTAGSAVAQTAEVQPLQSSTNYTAGAVLTVRCEITFPAGRQVLSLLWTPSLPADWTLAGTATGDGGPEVDPDGLAIVFTAENLSVNNPFVFHYTVNVPAGESGARILSGVAEYQLDGMANPVLSSSSPPLVLTDVSASHAAIGYIAGTPLTVTCSFVRPAGVALYSLLWQPVFPTADWQLVSGTEAVSGDGGPEVDPDGQAIVFMGDLSSTILTFSYTVLVPEGTTGPQMIDSVIEYQLDGMANPVETSAEPDPLILLPMHTLEIVSPHGTGQPGVGVTTNYYGTLLTNRMDAAVTNGAFQYGCAGWLMTGNEPVAGIGNECLLTLTNHAVLTWVWGAPEVGDRTVNEMEKLDFQAGVTYSQEAFQPRNVTYTLDADSLAAGMTITADGAFSWTPSEEQGGQSYEVTVTITASETGSQAFSASETFTIEVAEINRAPKLGELSDQVADAQSTLTFTATATDPDIPAQTLSFSLDEASLALGMAIGATNGVFTWSPTAEQAGAGQSYTVSITVTDDGAQPPALSDTKSFTIGVVDSRGEHASEGYLQGRTARIDCTFAHPAGKSLIALLWRPILPAGWGLHSVAGQASPEIDAGDGTIVFLGSSADLNTPNPLVFSYWVSVPAGVTGPQTIRAEAEYQTAGMVNPLTITIFPDPLPLPELHTFEVISAEAHCDPAPGIYTNVHGTALSASVTAPFTEGTRTFACTGWTLSGSDPADGTTHEVAFDLNQDAVLTWQWVAPLITPEGSVAVTMDEDGDPTAWQPPAGLTASEPYRPSLEESLEWTLKTAPANGTATVSGTGTTPTISYAPAADWSGNDAFVVQVADGLGGFDTVTVNVTVKPVNDAPVLAPIGDQRTDIFTPLIFTATATDKENDTLTFSLDQASIDAGMRIDPVSGVFEWTPTAEQAGAAFAEFSVTVTVTDNGTAPDNQSDSETFTITLDSSRATHAVSGYVAGQTMTVECTFAYPTEGRQLLSLLWRPELPDGWKVGAASGDGQPIYESSDGAVVFFGDLQANPVVFQYVVQVPENVQGTNAIGGLIEYQLSGMVNPSTVRAQPDPLPVPMLLTLPELVVSDKAYDGLTNATVSTYGALSGLMDGHTDVSLVTTSSVAFFDTPEVGQEKRVVVYGLALEGADASWYAISTQVVAAAITQAVLTVGGSFTVAEKVYDGTTAATIDVNALTLLTPVAGDDVTLNAVAAFDSADVGEGKPVTLTDASTLTGADAGNYVLSLEGAPTTTGTVLMPDVSGTQTLDGFRSPSSGTIIGSSFSIPEGTVLEELTWRPQLPAGWTLLAAAGDGAPSVVDGAVVFEGPYEGQTVSFTYTVSIPGNESVTNYLNASVSFKLENMLDALTVERLPETLLLKRYHSADYRAPFWVIDTSEATRFLNYSRIGGYVVQDNLQDGFFGTAMPDTTNLTDGRHSGDFKLPFWTIDTSEKVRLQSLWRAGAYHVSDTPTVDGYGMGPQ
ncbi:MAG TPA: YDG domain-containing protein, partial [Kiritimatiellia bacterium]|nr:YDG domain-containing protein [Kiritimatiellia bacterium]